VANTVLDESPSLDVKVVKLSSGSCANTRKENTRQRMINPAFFKATFNSIWSRSVIFGSLKGSHFS